MTRRLSALLGLVWLTWTNPAFYALQSGSPVAGPDAMNTLAVVEVYGSARVGAWPARPVPVLLDTIHVEGREGMSQQRSLYLASGSVWSLWTRAVSRSGGTSAEGNLIGVVAP